MQVSSTQVLPDLQIQLRILAIDSPLKGEGEAFGAPRGIQAWYRLVLELVMIQSRRTRNVKHPERKVDVQ